MVTHSSSRTSSPPVPSSLCVYVHSYKDVGVPHDRQTSPDRTTPELLPRHTFFFLGLSYSHPSFSLLRCRVFEVRIQRKSRGKFDVGKLPNLGVTPERWGLRVRGARKGTWDPVGEHEVVVKTETGRHSLYVSPRVVGDE